MDDISQPLLHTEADLLEAVDRAVRPYGGKLREPEIAALREAGKIGHEPWDQHDVDDVVQTVRKRRPEVGSRKAPLAAYQTRLQNESIRALRESGLWASELAIVSIVEEARRAAFGMTTPPFTSPGEAGRWLRAGYGVAGGTLPPATERVLRNTIETAADQIAERLHCPVAGPFGSLVHLLCGLAPVAPPVSIQTTSSNYASTRHTIVVNYGWVSAQTVRTAYLLAVQRSRGPSVRSNAARLPARAVDALLTLVDETPTLTWQERLRAWREQYPEWVNRYADVASMRASHAQAQRAWRAGARDRR